MAQAVMLSLSMKKKTRGGWRKNAGRKPAAVPCPFCTQVQASTRALRVHLAQCPQRPPR
jgi:hypothetical protein